MNHEALVKEFNELAARLEREFRALQAVLDKWRTR